MKSELECDLNGTKYWVDEYPRGFGWVNSRDEESDDFGTLLEAQQDAINWESGRRERDHEAALEEQEDWQARKEWRSRMRAEGLV